MDLRKYNTAIGKVLRETRSKLMRLSDWLKASCPKTGYPKTGTLWQRRFSRRPALQPAYLPARASRAEEAIRVLNADATPPTKFRITTRGMQRRPFWS